jgi:hypothetical protein
MSSPSSLDKFYVGWSDDNRIYQLLGLYEADSMKDAVNDASKNHGKPGRYLVMPEDKVTLFEVTFDMVPQLDKVQEADTIPPPETPVIIP